MNQSINKEIAFNIVKIRSIIDSLNPYTISAEVIYNLYSLFGEFNIEAKYEALLYNPKFYIGIINPDKEFNKFLARYTVAIAFL